VSGLTEAEQMIISTQYGRLSVVLEVTAALVLIISRGNTT
jgi:hypothetical protein